MLTYLHWSAVLPNPGGNNVKVVHVDKFKSKRVLAEVTIHASVKEVCSAVLFPTFRTALMIAPQEEPSFPILACLIQRWCVRAGKVL